MWTVWIVNKIASTTSFKKWTISYEVEQQRTNNICLLCFYVFRWICLWRWTGHIWSQEQFLSFRCKCFRRHRGPKTTKLALHYQEKYLCRLWNIIDALLFYSLIVRVTCSSQCVPFFKFVGNLVVIMPLSLFDEDGLQ